MFKLNKKSQITIFIIIGIVILFSSALVFYIRSEVREQEIQTFEEPLMQEVPSDIQPVRDYVTECVKKTARDALVIMGSQGGWIYANDFLITDDFTESDGINFTGIIPYWQYMSSPNDCVFCEFRSNRPTLARSVNPFNSMEAQLDKYVNTNLDTCFRNFESFDELGYEIVAGDVDTLSSIAAQDVRFIVNMPLTVSYGDTDIDLDKFYYSEPLKLKDMYNLASSISDAQQTYKFLEKNTLEVINMFQGLKKESLPPFYNIQLKMSKIFWFTRDVKKMLEDLMMSYINYMQVYLSANYNRVEFDDTIMGSVFQKFYDNMIVELSGFEEFDVNFNYFNNWGSYMTLNGGRAYTTSDTTFGGIFIVKMAISKYINNYDFSYPVLVQIDDNKAFDGKGYTFNIALETNIRNNKPLNDTDVSYIVNQTNEATFYCEPENYQSGDITVEVIDGSTRKGVKDAFVVWNAGEACPMGQTNASGYLTTKMPIGLGEIQVLKENYLGKKVAFDTDENEKRITITVYPLKEVNIDVKKFVFKSDFGSWQPVTEELKDINMLDEIFLTFERVNEGDTEDFSTVAVVAGNESVHTMDLYPGKYTVSGILNTNLEVVFQPHERTESSLFGDESFWIPPETLYYGKPALLGGVELNEDNGQWEIWQSLYDAEKITFKVVYIDLPLHPDPDVEYDLSQLEKLDQYYISYRSLLEPEVE